MVERRNIPRVNSRLAAEYCLPDGDGTRHLTEIVNLSPLGVAFEVNSELAVQQRVELSVEMTSGQKLHLMGIVIWNGSSGRPERRIAGAKIIDLTPEDESILVEYYSAHRRPPNAPPDPV